MYQKQRKHLSGEVKDIIFFQCLGLTTLYYVEEKQPYPGADPGGGGGGGGGGGLGG